jgi:hypothetical protein
MGLPSEEVDEERGGGCKAASLFLFSLDSKAICLMPKPHQNRGAGNVLQL